VTYIGKPIKAGFAINYANPALNLYPAWAARLALFKNWETSAK
jgi:hypothetical protein